MLYQTGEIVRDTLDQSFPEAHFSTYFLRRLNELSLSIIDVLSKDAESFAVHAKRNTIFTDDLFLCLRHSPYHSRLIQLAKEQGMKLSTKILEKIEADLSSSSLTEDTSNTKE